MTLQNIAGTWFFNGKSKTADLKKGESVTLNVTSDRTLFLDPEGNEIQLNIQVATGLSEIRTLLLKRLSNKELELNLDETHTTTSTDGTNSISTSVATSGIQTFKKK